jgi:hypothetical protein
VQAFNEIKNYYNDITSNNLDLIKTLKEDVAEMKKKEALNEKLMYEISTENKRLSEPLNRALKVRHLGGDAEHMHAVHACADLEPPCLCALATHKGKCSSPRLPPFDTGPVGPAAASMLEKFQQTRNTKL